MWIRIEPLDVLLFRESKPFSAGENFRAAGRFPPSPLPLVGAIRSRIMAHIDVDVGEYARCAKEKKDFEAFSRIGKPDRLAPLAVMGPFLVSGGPTVCLPWPLDLLSLREDVNDPNKRGSAVFLKPKAAEIPWPVKSHAEDCPLQNLTPANVSTDMEVPEGGFMNGDGLTAYLTEGIEDRMPYIENIRQGDIAAAEARLGITLGAGRTAEQGRIYSAAFTRPLGAAFWLQLRGVNDPMRERDLLPESGFLALGGEARAARFRILSAAQDEGQDEGEEGLPELLKVEEMGNLKEELIGKLDGHRRFKLYLLTPAIFRQGWIPDAVVARTFQWSDAEGIGARLVAAAVGKPDDIGGWDLVSKAPRTLYRAVPAGSVYFFEAERDFSVETARSLIEKLHFQSLMRPRNDSDAFPGFCREAGFGLSAVGLWDYQ